MKPRGAMITRTVVALTSEDAALLRAYEAELYRVECDRRDVVDARRARRRAVIVDELLQAGTHPDVVHDHARALQEAR